MGFNIDLTNQTFGYLTVLSYDHSDTRYGSYWKCQCVCGNIVVVRSNDLRTGNTKSCGCKHHILGTGHGHQFKDLTGQRFGRLTVLRLAGKDKFNRSIWECKCDCGNVLNVRATSLQRGTRSCGCIRQASKTVRSISRSPIYHRWLGMMARCYNPKNNNYYRYGARGIYVCDEWHDLDTFYYWAVNNGFSPELTIDRIDNDGPYAPWNCRWITADEQQRNTSRTVRIADDHQMLTVAEFATKYRIKPARYHQLRARLGPSGAVFAIKYPELQLRYADGAYYDRDGFQHVIPRVVYIDKKPV